MVIGWDGFLKHLGKGKIEILPGGVTVLTGQSGSRKRSLLFLVYETLRIIQGPLNRANQRTRLLGFLREHHNLTPQNFRITDEKGNIFSFSQELGNIEVTLPKSFSIETVFNEDPHGDYSKMLCLLHPEDNLSLGDQIVKIKYLISRDDISRILMVTSSPAIVKTVQECTEADNRLKPRTRFYYLDPPNTIDATKNVDIIKRSFLA